MSDLDRVQELSRAGLQCSQILMTFALELQGTTNPALIRATHGLCQGMATGETCGALTGGACVLGVYAGRGSPQDEDDPRLLFMLDELVEWFKEGYGRSYGSLRCEDIVGDFGQHLTDRCPAMVVGVHQKVTELLVENGFDLAASVPGPDGTGGSGGQARG